MAIVTFDHYKYTPEQALGPEVCTMATAIYHNGDMTVTVEGVEQGMADTAIAAHLIDSARQLKYKEVNSWRDKQESSGFEWNGTKWDSDPKSFTRVSSCALAGIAPPGGFWTDYHNNDVPMTLSSLQQLYAAMVEKAGAIHRRQRAMKTEIASATSLEEIESYKVGWP